MNTEQGRKTEVAHWDKAWAGRPRPRLPSSLLAVTKNVQDLLRNYVVPGLSFLEIGCAPGKHLAWCAAVLGAKVSGLDYSPVGFAATQQLFEDLEIAADLRKEDVFTTSFPDESFDVVFSNGVIEHFDDPVRIVRKHLELTKPGGWVVISVPNYGGCYARMQRRLDPENLGVHNLNIMSLDALRRLVGSDLAETIEVFASGRPSPSIVSWHKVVGQRLGKWLVIAGELVCRLSPVSPEALRPMLVLAVRRRR